MASHQFQIVIKRTPSDPEGFPRSMTVTECLWCGSWHLSQIMGQKGIECPYCVIDFLKMEKRADGHS